MGRQCVVIPPFIQSAAREVPYVLTCILITSLARAFQVAETITGLGEIESFTVRIREAMQRTMH